MPKKKTPPTARKKKAPRAAGTRAIQHKAYSYTNQKGKVVHVGAHTEHIKPKK